MFNRFEIQSLRNLIGLDQNFCAFQLGLQFENYLTPNINDKNDIIKEKCTIITHGSDNYYIIKEKCIIIRLNKVLVHFFQQFFYSCHYEKNGCFVIGLTTQFLNCRKHLQLIIFIRYGC
jgi:hypothetical protein